MGGVKGPSAVLVTAAAQAEDKALQFSTWGTDKVVFRT